MQKYLRELNKVNNKKIIQWQNDMPILLGVYGL